MFWLLEADAPWWLLTHYPSQNDAFTWLDGLCIVLYLGASSLVLGGGLHALLHLASRLADQSSGFTRQLSLCLLPLGAVGLFLGLSATTVKLLRYEGVQLLWVQPARANLLLAATVWGLWLGWQVCRPLTSRQRLPLLATLVLASLLIGAAWHLQFWGW